MVVIADIDSLVDIQGRLNGHFLAVANLYRRVFGDGCRVAGGEPYARFRDFLRLPFCARREGSRLVNKIKNLANVYSLFRQVRGETIIFQSQVPLTVLLGILLFARKEKIFLIYYEGLCGGLRKILWRIVRRKVAGVICPSEKVGLTYRVKYLSVTDYIYVPHKLQEDVTSKFKYDFATVGILSAEKGIEKAIQIVGQTGLRYLVAGRARTDKDRIWLEIAAKPYPNVDLKIGYATDEAYDHYIRESKCGLLNYSEAYSEHSSGVVFDFLFRMRPVIGHTCETLNFIAERGLGTVYENLETVDLKETLQTISSISTKTALRDYLRWNARQADVLLRFVQGSS